MTEQAAVNAVIYTDGGAQPNPGWAGSGVHGYLFSHDEPKKGLGLGSIVATSNGYRDKVKNGKLKEVTVLKYIDLYSTVPGQMRTNNQGELMAVVNALRYCARYNLVSIKFFLDSEYVEKGINERLRNWVKYNWTRPDGSQIKNQEYWMEFISARDELMARGVDLTFTWMKGHVDNPEYVGNHKADELATAGRIKAKTTCGSPFQSNIETEANGYWKEDGDRDPFFFLRHMYYPTQKSENQPGVYYLGNQGPKDDTMFGVRVSDGSFGVVNLHTPNEGLEEIRNSLCNPEGEERRIAALNMDVFFSGGFVKDWQTFGSVAYERQDDDHANAKTLDSNLLSGEFNPPGHSFRAIETVTTLRRILEGLETNQYQSVPHITVTDITGEFYETQMVKKGNKKDAPLEAKTSLKDQFKTGASIHKLSAKYDNQSVTAGKGEVPITLTFGIDLPDRNALKRLEVESPTIYLLCITESEMSFRYYVAVKTSRGAGVFGAIYSNLRMII